MEFGRHATDAVLLTHSSDALNHTLFQAWMHPLPSAMINLRQLDLKFQCTQLFEKRARNCRSLCIDWFIAVLSLFAFTTFILSFQPFIRKHCFQIVGQTMRSVTWNRFLIEMLCCCILFCRDVSVIFPTVVSKLTVTVFTSRWYFQTFWPKWLYFFKPFKNNFRLWPQKSSFAYMCLGYCITHVENSCLNN